jgi:hypothetical protein
MTFHAPFDLDLALALKGQLVIALEKLDLGALKDGSIGQLEPKQGVYKLFQKDKLVYVGKADNLQKRIGEHLRKIKGRLSITPAEMRFKCIYMGPNWTTLAPEEALIKYFKNLGEGKCEWNGNGFGPHDPGREREETNKPMEGFDTKYPIRHDWRCDFVTAGKWNVLKLLIALKDNLPFLLRYQTAGKKVHYTKGHADQVETTISLPNDAMPADTLLELVARAMPGWQATRFPGHMILYKESKDYRYGIKL